MLSAADVCSISWRSQSGGLAGSRPADFSASSAWRVRLRPSGSIRLFRPGAVSWSGALVSTPITPSRISSLSRGFVLDHWTPHGDGGEFSLPKLIVGSSGRTQSHPSLPAPTRRQALASLTAPTRLDVLVLFPAPTHLHVVPPGSGACLSFSVPTGSGIPGSLGTAPTRDCAYHASSLCSTTFVVQTCAQNSPTAPPQPPDPTEVRSQTPNIWG